MSVTNENVDEKLNHAVEEVVPADSLGELFKDRVKDRESRKLEEQTKEEIPEKSEKEVLKIKKSKDSKPSEDKEDSKRSIVEPEVKVSDKKEPEAKVDDDEDRELEVGKLRKALNDSQKWGHTNNKRLKSVVKIVGALKEQGILTEDEFTNLNELLNSDSAEEEAEIVNVNISPMAKLVKIANNRLEDLRELYEDDPLFNKKIAAFDLCINNSSDQEIDDIYDDLETFESTPLKLVKRMYQIGERYYNEGFNEIDKAGGLKNFLFEKNTELKRLQKKIDKLESKLLEYNDHDKPTYKIDELGDTLHENVSTDKPGDVLGSLFKERDRKKNKVKGY